MPPARDAHVDRINDRAGTDKDDEVPSSSGRSAGVFCARIDAPPMTPQTAVSYIYVGYVTPEGLVSEMRIPREGAQIAKRHGWLALDERTQGLMPAPLAPAADLTCPDCAARGYASRLPDGRLCLLCGHIWTPQGPDGYAG